jgi:hypothetical protein
MSRGESLILCLVLPRRGLLLQRGKDRRVPRLVLPAPVALVPGSLPATAHADLAFAAILY